MNDRFHYMITRRSFLMQSIGAFGMTIPQFSRAQSTKLWVPPEDHPHEATFMQWPVDPAVYTDHYHLKQVQNTIATIANTISAFEPVIMLADACFMGLHVNYCRIRWSCGTSPQTIYGAATAVRSLHL